MSTNEHQSVENAPLSKSNIIEISNPWPQRLMLFGIMVCGLGLIRAGAFEKPDAINLIGLGVTFMVTGFIAKSLGRKKVTDDSESKTEECKAVIQSSKDVRDNPATPSNENVTAEELWNKVESLSTSEFIEYLIAHDCRSIIESNMPGKRNYSILRHFAAAGSLGAIKAIVAQGATLNFENGDVNPLHVAASEGYADIVSFLLEKGANPLVGDHNNWVPIRWGIEHPEVVRILAEKAGVNRKYQAGCTALLHAAADGCVETTKLLLELGADRNIANDFGKKPINFAEKDEIKQLLS